MNILRTPNNNTSKNIRQTMKEIQLYTFVRLYICTLCRNYLSTIHLVLFQIWLNSNIAIETTLAYYIKINYKLYALWTEVNNHE